MQGASTNRVLCDRAGRTAMKPAPRRELLCQDHVKAHTRPTANRESRPALFQLLTQDCSKLTLSSLNFELEKVYFGFSEVLYGKWGVSPRRQCHFFLTLLQTFIYSRPGKLGCSVHWAFSCTQVKSLSSFYILHFVPL